MINTEVSKIEKELAKCREAAEEGYQLAREQYTKIEKTLAEESRKIADAQKQQDKVSRIKNIDFMDKQKKDLEKLKQAISVIRDDISTLHERQKDFSIIVYGRTMAGKSTLMEILTHGEGKSIGKGAQRTTLDVREYHWQGLKITDVPGICAFGGAEDERLAMEAAKTADLILFLLTNDAPQADEAQCLAQLKRLGKPILGVINVKKALNFDKRALALRDLQKVLNNTEEIEAILTQFKAFDKRHNQDWSDIKFVSTHLRAAYQAHPGRNNDAEIYEASRFGEVENFILDKVKNDGRFLRIKTFIDSVAVPMNRITEKIFEHSANTLLESDIWFDKRQQLIKWREKFLERSQAKLDQIYDELADNLNAEIHSFSEEHYEDEKVNEHWSNRVKSLGYVERYQNLLQSFSNECERKCHELSDELTQQLSYSFSGNTNTNVSLKDTSTFWKNAALIAPNLLIFIPGLGWGARIAIGVGSMIFSALFDDKEKKIREAKQKLREDLTAPSFEMLNKMHDGVVNVFNEQILASIDNFADLLTEYGFMLTNLGKAQAEIAHALNKEYADLNFELVSEALNYQNAGVITVSDTVRIPGEILIASTNNRTNLNRRAVSDLLGERFLINTNPPKDLRERLEMILDCETKGEFYPLEFDTDEKEGKQTLAIIPQGEVDETDFRLAQQISPYPIILR